jgi:hypothetical protein
MRKVAIEHHSQSDAAQKSTCREKVQDSYNHIMKSWRLSWAITEISDTSNFSKHTQALHSSWKFWVALVFKLVPGVWPFTIQLRLRQGGVVAVKEFMTLYIYKEIFVEGCYDDPAPFIIDVGTNTVYSSYE